jgi:hypothetical protein
MLYLENQLNKLEENIKPGEVLNAHVSFNGANYYAKIDENYKSDGIAIDLEIQQRASNE